MLEGGLVYSTERGGEVCPACGAAIHACTCRQNGVSLASPRDGIVRVGRETKGRKGKGVTVITGIPLPLPELTALCTELKKKCGSGGAIKEGVLEIQGDHRDAIISELAIFGWTIKRTGG